MVLAHGLPQLRESGPALVEEGPYQPLVPVFHFPGNLHRDVAGEVHYCNRFPGSRIGPVYLGRLSFSMGRNLDFLGKLWLVFRTDFSFSAIFACDSDG